ncbi:SRPBCC family protein [Sinorhizobium numidicum]|uniref:SRPBCC family protein n=1 Tax=Sinorhizobium numidicum TaxID=680248 RepID=A0ABY8D0G3_9HYPH|nr:SRPBCC family protein [Sinorhizobium numidicum]WEX77720.1 SRPBCC family protein [Sinorhizobium numidicum]WEX84380.1 SRPBCC family protein [Sinorhizobium numidicum]
MTKEPASRRTDSASRIVKASPPTVYQALLDPEAVAKWLPPEGMKGEIYRFEPWEGGAYRMALVYEEPDHRTPGKTSGHADLVAGRFVQLIPDERVVQQAEFESDDPAFAGTMTIIWALEPASDGTLVTVICENVPPGISRQDHEAALSSTLANLATFTE